MISPIHSPLAVAIGQTLLHTLWEGGFIAAALACVVALSRSPRVRYLAGIAAMILMAAAFLATLARMLPLADRAALFPLNASAARYGTAASLTLAIGPGSRVFAIAPFLAPFWLAGVLLFYAWRITGWIGLERMRRTGARPAPEVWQRRIAGLRQTFGVDRTVRLLESSLAAAPQVLGHFRPVILLPVGLLTGLPAGQIEAILLHELAHIARRDYLANLVATLAEGILFYHPAVWWIARVIREEREKCCDDLVLKAGADSLVYASALTELEIMRAGVVEPALAATGGSLMKRIERLLCPRPANGGSKPVWAAAALLFALFAVVVRLAPAQNGAVEPAFRQWLNQDVAYIITDQERAAFLKLTTDAERERFVEEFWLRRDPTPGTPENEFKEEHYRRIAFANQHFASNVAGWKTDRGRIYITFGPPDQITRRAAAADSSSGSQIWTYRYIEGIGSNITLTFTGENYHLLAPGYPQ